MKVTKINWRQDRGEEQRTEERVQQGSPIDLIMNHEGVESVKITRFSGDSVTYRKSPEVS